MKKCPPGVICVENYSMFFFIICIAIIVYLIYNNVRGQNIIVNNKPSEKIVIKDTQRENGYMGGWFGGFMPSWPYTNLPSDPLLNPYAPPLRDERYFVPGYPMGGVPLGAIPINMSTNIGAVDTTYRQLGILTPTNGASKDNIIPLMGRPLFTNRDKWQYYSTSNQHNNVKLPVSRAGRSCTNEYGCDKLYNSDTVYVEGVNEAYKVTMYDNDTIKYLPFV
jgi:hypothetical protein